MPARTNVDRPDALALDHVMPARTNSDRPDALAYAGLHSNQSSRAQQLCQHQRHAAQCPSFTT